MKTAIIYYVFFSVILLVAIYFFTLILVSRSRNLDVFLALQEEAVATSNYDDFVSFQSVAYQRVYNDETDDFFISAYQVIAKDSTGYRHQFMWILTEKTSMSHATSDEDTNDLTSLKITKHGTDQVLFDSSIVDIYQSKPISYGLERYGYYYYIFFLESSETIDIEHIGYTGDVIYQSTITYDYVPYLESNDFLPGMTEEEKDELIDINTYLEPEMRRNITTFLIVDILCGGALFMFFKFKKR